MYIFDLTNPLTLILMLAVIVLLIFLGQEVKKSYIAFIPLFLSLILLIIHGAQLVTLQEEFKELAPKLFNCIAIDFILTGVTFFGYLWIDDIEAKAKGIKSVDDSLDWFWKKV